MIEGGREKGSYFHMPRAVQQQVLELEISVHDPTLVQVCQGQAHFCSVKSSALFSKFLASFQMKKELHAVRGKSIK